MKIFIGGAYEDCNSLREIEAWVSEQDHEAWPWDKPGTFTIGVATYPRLIEISREVQAAIIIFSPSDKVHYRGDAKGQPRDNVLIEYGLFSSILGPEKCAIAMIGDSKFATDLAGISFLDFRGKRKPHGRMEFNIWLRNLSSDPIDPAIAKKIALTRRLEQENEQLKQALSFERDNSRKFKNILADNNIVNFSDLGSDRYWKILFDYDSVNKLADIIKSQINTPQDLRKLIEKAKIKNISEAIGWETTDITPGINRNPYENGKFCRKTLRTLKMIGSKDDVDKFVNDTSPSIASAFSEVTESFGVEQS